MPDDRRDAVRYGLIGVGKPSEVAAILDRLGPRMRLSCVYEPVGYLAPLVAEAAGVPVVRSVRHVTKRRGVQAAVVVSAGTIGVDLCRPLLGKNLPTLWLDPQTQFDPRWIAGGLAERDELATIVPAMTHRYAGSTLRLRELLVGPLGRVAAIDGTYATGGGGNASATADRDLARLVDWCRWLTHPRVARESGDRWTFSGAGVGPVTATLAPGDSDRLSLQTERGTAELTVTSLRWQTGGGDWTETDLSEERDALSVAADLFARRVIGGLVPTPTLDDVAAVLGAM